LTSWIHSIEHTNTKYENLPDSTFWKSIFYDTRTTCAVAHENIFYHLGQRCFRKNFFIRSLLQLYHYTARFEQIFLKNVLVQFYICSVNIVHLLPFFLAIISPRGAAVLAFFSKCFVKLLKKDKNNEKKRKYMKRQNFKCHI